MSTTLTEAARMALDALESRCGTEAEERGPGGAITALRAALAQQAPEAVPVARVLSWTNGSRWRNYTLEWLQDVPAGAALYAAPVAQPAPAVAQQGGDLEREREARKAAQIENEAMKDRLARARLDLMRELREQGWTPPAAHAQQPAQPAALTDAQIDEVRRVADALQASADYNSSMTEYSYADYYRAAELLRTFAGITATQAPTTDTGGQKCRACAGTGEDFNEGDPCHVCGGNGKVPAPTTDQPALTVAQLAAMCGGDEAHEAQRFDFTHKPAPTTGEQR